MSDNAAVADFQRLPNQFQLPALFEPNLQGAMPRTSAAAGRSDLSIISEKRRAHLMPSLPDHYTLQWMLPGMKSEQLQV
jgi:hypothetical protein